VSPEVPERAFEDAIECALREYGPDACVDDATVVREASPPYDDNPPGGCRKRSPEDYDRTLCLLPRDVVDFVLATQPKEWQKLEQDHGAAVREWFLTRLAAEIERRGALDVLRGGIKDSCCKFRGPEGLSQLSSSHPRQLAASPTARCLCWRRGRRRTTSTRCRVS
jgi:hypothetical protein